MAEYSRQAERDLHATIFHARADRGVQAFHDWLLVQQSVLNATWHTMKGDDLLQAQGKAELLRKAISLITKPPLQTQEIDHGSTTER